MRNAAGCHQHIKLRNDAEIADNLPKGTKCTWTMRWAWKTDPWETQHGTAAESDRSHPPRLT